MSFCVDITRLPKEPGIIGNHVLYFVFLPIFIYNANLSARGYLSIGCEHKAGHYRWFGFFLSEIAFSSK